MSKAGNKSKDVKVENFKIPLLEKIKSELADRYACYVLITCGEAGSDGSMQVEMSYEGDEVLASYLVENAQQIFHRQEQMRKPMK